MEEKRGRKKCFDRRKSEIPLTLIFFEMCWSAYTDWKLKFTCENKLTSENFLKKKSKKNIEQSTDQIDHRKFQLN